MTDEPVTRNPMDATGLRRVVVDFEKAVVEMEDDEGAREFAFDTPEAFAAVSRGWLRVGWDTKYVYSFSWMGRPLIQLPEDVLRVQEAIYRVKPDVIIETGVAHGGSLVFYASLCEAMGHGRVVGVDIEIRPHNRSAIEAHELFHRITLIEGSSTDEAVLEQVRAQVEPGQKVMVLLDGNHTRDHVADELRLYGPLVSPGSYMVAADGLMQDLVGGPRTMDDWDWNNPTQAAIAFAAEFPDEWELAEPGPDFQEGVVERFVTYFKSGWLRKKG